MRHNLYFRTVNDAQTALVLIKQKFTQNVISEGSVLSFTTPYTIRSAVQTSLTQTVKSYKGDFNVNEGEK